MPLLELFARVVQPIHPFGQGGFIVSVRPEDFAHPHVAILFIVKDALRHVAGGVDQTVASVYAMGVLATTFGVL